MSFHSFGFKGPHLGRRPDHPQAQTLRISPLQDFPTGFKILSQFVIVLRVFGSGPVAAVSHSKGEVRLGKRSILRVAAAKTAFQSPRVIGNSPWPAVEATKMAYSLVSSSRLRESWRCLTDRRKGDQGFRCMRLRA